MVFKRGVALLVLAAAAAVASTEASAPITVHSNLKHPVVKDVKEQNGKLILTLHEDTKVQKKTAEKKHEAKKHHETKKQQVKKLAPKKPFVVKVAPKKDQHKKHPEDPEDKKHEDKKHHDAKKHKEVKKANHKQVSEEKKGHEIIRKYAHGEVRVSAKNQPAQKKQEKKPVVKKEAPKKHLTKEEVAETIEETDVDLQVGESVSLEFGNHTIELELLTNGSLILTADDETYVLPAGDVDLDFDGDVDGADVDEDSSSSSDSGSDSDADAGSEADGVEAAAGDNTKEESVAEKFTELATKLTGNGKYFSKDAAPIVFAGGVIGALAAIVGIAAIAIGRARDNSAAADPQSVLAEATEDVEADVEAAASTEESSEDAAADDSQSLDSSDSESDAEEEQEEGKFTNEVASV